MKKIGSSILPSANSSSEETNVFDSSEGVTSSYFVSGEPKSLDALENATEALSSDNTIEPIHPTLSLGSKLPKSTTGYCLADLKLEEQPVEYIAGMFPKGKVSALVGESGKGKGWVLPAASMTITSGKPFLPNTDYEIRDDGKVLIIDTEARIATYSRRLKELGGNLKNYFIPADPTKLLVYRRKEDRKLIEKSIQDFGTELIILDSFAGFSNADENSSGVNDALTWFLEITLKYNVALVFTQLVNKGELLDGKITLKSVRGHSEIAQFAEAIWAIDTPNTHNDKTKRLYQVKNNNHMKDSQEYIFTLENSIITFTDEVIQTEKAKIAKRLEILNANKGKKPAEIAKLIKAIEPDTLENTLTTWVARNSK